MTNDTTGPLPLQSTMMAWIDGRRARGEISANTHRGSRYHIGRFAAHFGDDTDLRTITAAQVEGWLELLDVQPSSRNTICGTLRTFFTWAVRREMVARDPFLDVRAAKVPHRQPRCVPPHVIQAVVSSEGTEFRARVMITICAHEGLRRAELADLRVEDWDRRQRTLFIRNGKGAKERTVAVHDETQAALAAWLADGRERGPMWPSPRGGALHPNRIAALITEQFERIGHHVTPHQLRHTMASQMVLEGAPLTIVRDRLGHANLATTDIYSHASVEDQRPWLSSRTYYARDDAAMAWMAEGLGRFSRFT